MTSASTSGRQTGNTSTRRKAGAGSQRLFASESKDRVQEEVLSLKDFPQLVDPFAEWYGLTPDGKVLLMRDRSVQEIYALDLAKK